MVQHTASYIRQPAVAGSFYPADPHKLAGMVDRLLAEPTASASPDPPKILIAPHAGYVYSGRVAGAGFAQLWGAAVARVILLGVSHHHYFSAAALSGSDCWQTPLGRVAIDREARTRLLESSPDFYIDDQVHQPEHGLEVELPFLQRVLGDFAILPVLLSQPAEGSDQQVGAELVNIMDEHTMLVVSSDLSHYPRQSDAERIDGHTIDAILSGDVEGFQHTITKQLASRVPALYTCACGAEAIKVAMRLAQMLKLNAARLLVYTNSGEVSGDTSRVVGYAALGIYPSGGESAH